MESYVDDNVELNQRRLGDRWLLLLCVCLLGYSLAGRGFADIGFAPIYIGEIILAAGVVVLLATRRWFNLTRIPAALVLLAYMVFGTLRLLPDLRNGIESVRDAVMWGYGTFAIVVAALIVSEPRRLLWLIDRYRRFITLFLVLIPFAFLAFRYGRSWMPTWPSGVAVIFMKEADVLVHLAGILAFWMADPNRKVGIWWAVLLTVNMAMMGVIDRAGLLAFGAVLCLCLVVKPLHGAAWRTIAMLACGAVILWVSQINIEVPGGKGRTISWEQFVENSKSIFGEGESRADESNKSWRLDWWKAIVGYTVDGPYFWSGKGFGINLADDDGFQVHSQGKLRSPHSIHMSALARMGVPGLVAWAAVNFVWMFSIADTHLRARRRGQQRWAGLFLFLFAYYCAFFINASFDVFLEGPMGGIWFWTIYGTGVGALWVWRNCPELLADPIEIDESARRAQFLSAAGWRRPGLPVGAGAS